MRRACFLALLLVFGGCHRQPPAAVQIATVAASPAGGRGPAAAQLVSRWKTGDHDTLSKAIDLAFEQLESITAKKPGPTTGVIAKSVDATAFAGAVLDAVEVLTMQLPMDPEHELFWMRVGSLARQASEEAFANGRLSEARSLVFAGGLRWQNEAYWMIHTGHDALASAILAQSGERAEAIRRLDERTDLNGPAAEMLDWLKKGR